MHNAGYALMLSNVMHLCIDGVERMRIMAIEDMIRMGSR